MKHYKSFLLVAVLLLIQNLFSQEQPVYQITKLVDGIYELVADGGGYPVKVIASVGDDGMLIVDTGEEKNGDALVEALQTLNKGMPNYLRFLRRSYHLIISLKISFKSFPTIFQSLSIARRSASSVD
jgi:hypothetical protein